MGSFALNVRTALRLGLANVGRVALYRGGLSIGMHPVLRIGADIAGHSFFARPIVKEFSHGYPPPYDRWREDALYFGWLGVALQGEPHDWHANPFQGTRVVRVKEPWHAIPDFDPAVGGIKTLWEASRFEWLRPMAQRARHGDQDELDRLNEWLAGWCNANPAFLGPNWKCGQEASIRVIHLAVAARILGQDTASQPDLMRLVRAHMVRCKC